METTLHVGGACAARELELDAATLAAAPPEHQVPDVGALAPGREGAAVRLIALAELARPTADARFVHVASADGGFTANVPLERALAQGLVLYAHGGAPLPARFGGPFRLLFVDADGAGEDCSLNVKFLGAVEFVAAEGAHTARCAEA
jgi:hypothetical protein